MDQTQLEAFTRALAERARRAPRSYQTRVVLLGALGYLYVLGVLALALAVPAATVFMVATGAGEVGAQLMLRLGLPAVVIAYAIIRALHVKFPAPSGVPLRVAEAPKLDDTLAELRAALGAPRFHRVLVTNEFNAAVAEVPRLGIFGWPRYYLILGLPLMAGLTTAQFRAVVAHELGHHSRRHGRVASWVYRIRVTWLQVVRQLRKARRGTWLFARFFNWYAPYFGAYSFVLARAQEYEADRHAAELTSAQDLGDALIAISVKSRYLGAVLRPSIDRMIELSEAPPDHAQRDLIRQLQGPPPIETAARYVTAALNEDTSGADTHPALRDRLAAVGYRVDADMAAAFSRTVSPEQTPAAAELLGTALLQRLTAQLDDAWQAGARKAWREAHDSLRRDRERLTVLQREAATRPLNAEESRARARLTESLDGAAAAIPLYSALVDAQPNDADSRFTLGRLLLVEGRPEARTHFEQLESDVWYGSIANRFLAAQYLDLGDADSARRHTAKALAQADLLDRAKEERSRWLKSDEFAEPTMPADDRDRIVQVLAGEPAVRTAYLMRKHVNHAPEYPVHLLIVLAKYGIITRSEPSMNRALAQRLVQTIQVDGDLRIRVYASRKDWLVSRARKLGHSRIYTKTS